MRREREEELMFAFRRATHTREGEERTELRDKHQDVWDVSGLTCHHMSTAKAMTLAEIHADIASDETNYMVGGSIGELDDRSPVPTVEEVARDIVLLIQCGLVEVMPAGWTREAMLERRAKSNLSPELRADLDAIKTATAEGRNCTGRLRRDHAGWARAWALIEQRHGNPSASDENGERWQYMGTFDGEHEFRHRGKGRDTVRELGGDYETVPAVGHMVPSSEADPEKCYSRPCFCGRCGR